MKIVIGEITVMENEKTRFNNLFKKKNAVQNLISYLQVTFNAGERIPGELELKDILGHPLQQTREALIVLESFGYLEIKERKPSTLLRSLSDQPLDVGEAILKSRLKDDEKFRNLVELIIKNHQVNSELPGVRQLSNHPDLYKDKLKEDLLRLECAGYIINSQGRRRKIIKDLSFLIM
ncbi:hypothetical protein WNY98_06400 [Pseudoalteromonas sp. AS71]|uniref:hypothetical protein n=1 Tax=Pseudoalteromonas sp. AS71 TaxID=3135777 RepID=UPI003181F80D